MKAVPPKFWMLVILLIITLFITPNDINAQSVVIPCKCEDVPDLLNLLNMDHAAVDGVDDYLLSEIGSVTPDFVNEILQEPNPNRLTKGDKVKEIIKNQMNWVKDQEAHTASSEIENVSCQREEVQAGTDCLKHIMEERNDFDLKYCQYFKKKYKLGEKEDIKNFMPLGDYLLWQMNLYRNEIAKILKILNGMDPVCRPKDWFGLITIKEEISSEIKIQTEKTEDSTFRIGMIRFNGKSLPQQLSLWKVEGKYINTKFAKEGKRDCTGGLDGPKPDTVYKTSFTMEINKTGGGPFPMTVDLGEPDDKNNVFIGLRIPQMIAIWDFNSRSTRESGCPNDSLKETYYYTTDFPLSSEPLNIEGHFVLGKTKFEPAQQIHAWGPFQDFYNETSGVRQFHCHWVKVHLYKIQK